MIFPTCFAYSKEAISVHDPVMIKHQGQYYLFSTGPGITIYHSKDMRHWQQQGRVFETEPSWARRVAPGFRGHLWAPDIFEKDGLYYLFYSVSAFGKNTSGMGVAVTKSLNPASPDYKWQDRGLILQSIPNRDWWNAIDPAVIQDEKGDFWMSFGSFWGGLKLVKLDESLTKIAEPQEWYSIAKRKERIDDQGVALPQEIEAPYIFRKGDWYYLFASWGLCCRGNKSTYHLVVGRSKSVSGPYLDKNGVDMAQGGGTLLLKGNKRWPGLGHNSVYHMDGKDYTVFHAYDSKNKGRQTLKVLELEWSRDLWPSVDSKKLDSFNAQVISP